MRTWIPRVRHAVPCAAVVARLAGPPNSSIAQWSAEAIRAGAGATLVHEEPAVSLRLTLTDPVNFAADIGGWLDGVVPGVAPKTRQLVAALIRAGMHTPSVTAALIRSGSSERNARRRLANANLATAGHFVRLGHLAPLLLDLQRRYNDPIEWVLRDHGAITTDALRERVGRLLAVTPATIRSTIGWEWWVHRLIAPSRYC